MKYHVQFLEVHNNKLCEAMGSDGVFILDGRNSLQTMTIDAIYRFHRLNKNIHSYRGWRIKKGSRFSNSVTIKEWVLSGDEYIE